METITIPVERYNELIRAEKDATQLKDVIDFAKHEWRGLSYDEITILYLLHFGKEE